MNPWMAVIAGLIGYLFGSISSARLVTGRVAPGTNISRVEEPIPNSDQKFIMESLSATNVRVQVGTRYGCLTAILDVLQVVQRRGFDARPGSNRPLELDSLRR